MGGGARFTLKRGDVVRIVGPDGAETRLTVIDCKPKGAQISLYDPTGRVRFLKGPPRVGENVPAVPPP